VAQLLGEIRVDERDNEWMYALNGATGDADGTNGATCAGPKLKSAHDAGRAAARARAIFLNQTPVVPGTADLAGSADASLSANDDSDATVGETPRALGGLSLAATNRAFMLVADIMRAAARVAVDAAGHGVVLSGCQKPQQQPSRAITSALVINNQVINGALGGQPTPSPSSVQCVPDIVLSELLAQFEHILEGAIATDGTVCALRQLVAAATAAPIAVAAGV
jgi:hypothetical protein